MCNAARPVPRALAPMRVRCTRSAHPCADGGAPGVHLGDEEGDSDYDDEDFEDEDADAQAAS